MKSLKSKILLICFFTIVIYIMLSKVTYAAYMNMSISKTSGYVGDTFSVTISGINGKVYISANSNVSISNSGSQWVDGSLTITGTAKSVGTGTITVAPEDATTTAAEPEEVTTSASRSITIKEKEIEKPSTPIDNSQATIQEMPKTPVKQTTTNQSKNTNTKSKTTADKVKTTEIKEEPKKSENFFISTLVLNGVNDNGEYIEIKLNPEFNREIYEYECNVGYDINKIEVQKDAGEFTDCIVITGLEEIKEGENIVKIELIEEGYETKTYTIKIIKDSKEIEENQNIDILETNEDKEKLIVSMPLWVFIVMETIIIISEAILIMLLDKTNKIKKQKIQ